MLRQHNAFSAASVRAAIRYLEFEVGVPLEAHREKYAEQTQHEKPAQELQEDRRLRSLNGILIEERNADAYQVLHEVLGPCRFLKLIRYTAGSYDESDRDLISRQFHFRLR
jgi:hypothetical protein